MNTNELIDAYISGTATEQEAEELLAWVKESPENEAEFAEACKIWHSIQGGKYDTAQALNDFRRKTRKPMRISLWARISSVAAAVAVAIVCVSVLHQTAPQSITIANEENIVKNVTLPDGTTIYLQNGASVTYPQEFGKHERSISTSGNVFCDVFRDETSPFTIANSDIRITVLGTSFEIHETDSLFVVVETGTVKVENTDEAVTITKGERADVRNGSIKASRNTDKNFLSWKTGVLHFSADNLTNVYSDLARHYNVLFDTSDADAALAQTKLTGTYKDMTLEETLQLIEMAIPAYHYTIGKGMVKVAAE